MIDEVKKSTFHLIPDSIESIKIVENHSKLSLNFKITFQQAKLPSYAPVKKLRTTKRFLLAVSQAPAELFILLSSFHRLTKKLNNNKAIIKVLKAKEKKEKYNTMYF
jgi:hypothetical protein